MCLGAHLMIDLVLRPPVLVFGGPYSNLRAVTAMRVRGACQIDVAGLRESATSAAHARMLFQSR